MIMIRSKSLKKLDQISFHLYRLIRGMANVLAFDTCDIKHQQQMIWIQTIIAHSVNEHLNKKKRETWRSFQFVLNVWSSNYSVGK